LKYAFIISICRRDFIYSIGQLIDISTRGEIDKSNDIIINEIIILKSTENIGDGSGVNVKSSIES
jgi:hypothetical protein